MKKLTSVFFVMLVLLLTASCGSSNPCVGDWIPESGNQDGVIELHSDGTAAYNQQSSDGSVYIKGEWATVEDQENEFTLKFDSSTAKVSADNPLVEMILARAAEIMASQTLTGQVSDDGKTMSFNGGFGSYIRK